jgi:hypothetical protein
MLKTTCATFALLALANPALAAGCATQADAAALKTAVMQQELMVADLQCHETSAYNRFVMTYRGELQASDAALKAFFVRRGGEHGEAGYDTFKTKAANLSALEQARDARSFCADAHTLFAAALNNRGSLMSFVDTRSGATDIANICVESRPAPVLARADVKPEKAPALVRVAEVRTSEVHPVDVAVGGVPAHSLPAIPYRHEDRVSDAPPPFRAADRQEDRVAAREEEEDDVAPSYANADEDYAPPPPRPRYYQIRNRASDERDFQQRDYQDRDAYYPPRAYGPPPGWRQDWRDDPRYGAYPRDPYERW